MEQVNKKGLYEQKKQQKLEVKEIQRKERQKGRFLFILSIIIPLVIVGIIISYAIFYSSGTDIPNIGEVFPDQGREHIEEGAEHPAYNSNPPTSGWHYAVWADWGVYKEELPQERLIHNLEHGGIVIQYKPDLDPATVTKLDDLKKNEFECKLVVVPSSKLDKSIVLSAWTRLYKTDTYEEETIKDFIKKYRNRAPELVPCSVKPSPMQK